jgi:outer membrane lipoprotein-sorting protein
MNILRRLPLSRLLLTCALVVAIGVSATALAFALGTGPVPPAKPLAQAVHDTLASAHSHSIEGVSASVTLSDRLLEGANLAGGAGGGEITSSPLVTGGSGRLWIARDGKLRLELQSQKGDTQITYDGHTVKLYDAANNTLYKYTPPAREGSGHDEGPGKDAEGPGHDREAEVPSVAKIEEAIARLGKHADVSGASPTDVAGQPAYTVRISPKEGGSLLGGVELSFDAVHGVPLRAAVYSTATSTPVVELAAGEISYGPVSPSVFELNPPSDVKVEEVKPEGREGHEGAPGKPDEAPKLTTHGHGPATIAVLASKGKGEGGQGAGGTLEGLPKVSIDGVSASELRTELGTVLTFERGGVRYLLAGSVEPSAVEAVARGL